MNTLASIKTQSWLSWFLRGVLILGFLFLIGRSFEVQIIKGAYFRALAEENRIRIVPLPAPRGKILARGGEILVGNIEQKKKVLFDAGTGYRFTDNLIGAKPDELVSDYKRNYVLGPAFAHASGYLSEAAADKVGKIDPNCPDRGPVDAGILVGVSGLEQKYNCTLSGISGEELIEVNTRGEKVRTLAIKPPIPGIDLKTTIDFNLQKEVATEMGQKKGAALVTDPNGEVLAFYSGPSFDPSNLGPSLSNADLPLFDRAISGLFSPGSVFKPFVSLAALEAGVIDKNFVFDDPGVITVNGFSYSNWFYSEYGRTEGKIDLTRAIARSTDTFFYKIGEMVGPDKIALWASKFGLGSPTGVDLPGEASGLVPTPAWKYATKGEYWFLGNTYHYSIGQGDVVLTPIEINTGVSAIAADGKLCSPHIASFSGNQNVNCKDLKIQKEDLDLVKEGMKEACASGGTAYTFFDFSEKHHGQVVACKTGTAEVGTNGTPNAWFTLFTPVEKPQIVLTIVFEKAGQGSEIAGPVARKIMNYYYK